MGNNENLMKSLEDFFGDKVTPEYFAQTLCNLVSKADLKDAKTKENAWLVSQFVGLLLEDGTEYN